MNTMIEINAQHNRANILLKRNRIKDAFTVLKKMTKAANHDLLMADIMQIEDNYKNIGQYLFKGMKDPNHDEIIKRLKHDFYELNDKVRHHLFNKNMAINPYFKNEELTIQSASDVENIITELDLSDNILDIFSNAEELSDINIFSAVKTEDSIDIHQLFNHFITTPILNEFEVDLLNKLNISTTIPTHDKSLLVSAITFSLMLTYDEQKFDSLLSYLQQHEEGVWQRALTGLVINLYLYDYRISESKTINKIIFQLSDNEQYEKDIENIILQFNRSKNTEKVSKKMEEEIIPEMMKLKPDLEDKMGLSNLMKNEFEEDDEKNPMWETFFKDTPDLADKIEEVNKMQQEGADIYMSAFSKLKNFDFFKRISNWMLPFYPENKELQNTLPDHLSETGTHKFFESLSLSPFMCNSDKYSFVLNIKNLPKPQVEMMFGMIEAEIGQINELFSQQDLLDNNVKNKAVYTTYIQDLYRFFKLSDIRHFFDDIFEDTLHFHTSMVFQKIIQNKDVVRNFAEYYFESGYYKQAIDIYLHLSEEEQIPNPEIFEKLGYAYFKLNQYEKALSFFKKAELFDSNRVWNLKQIAFCYQHLKNSEKAMEYFLDAARLDERNLTIQKHIAFAYLRESQFEEALSYFLKIHESLPNNKQIIRSIVWCAFVVGKIDLAHHHALEMVENNPNPHDLINYGHIQWVKHDMDDVAKYYKACIKHPDSSLKQFLTTMHNDKQYLIKNGVNETDIPVILDHVRYCL